MDKDFYLELRRQALHIVLGITAIILIDANLAGLKFFGGLLIIGVLLSIIASKSNILVLQWLLYKFDRKKVSVPGQGALFMVAGIIISLFLFEKNVALAAIMIVTLGDSFSHFFGRFFGSVQHPLNKHKLIEGTLIGFAAATLGALFFVTIPEAIAASAIAMLVEGLELKYRNNKVDDNLVIPLVAGFVIYFMRLLN